MFLSGETINPYFLLNVNKISNSREHRWEQKKDATPFYFYLFTYLQSGAIFHNRSLRCETMEEKNF